MGTLAFIPPENRIVQYFYIPSAGWVSTSGRFYSIPFSFPPYSGRSVSWRQLDWSLTGDLNSAPLHRQANWLNSALFWYILCVCVCAGLVALYIFGFKLFALIPPFLIKPARIVRLCNYGSVSHWWEDDAWMCHRRCAASVSLITARYLLKFSNGLCDRRRCFLVVEVEQKRIIQIISLYLNLFFF